MDCSVHYFTLCKDVSYFNLLNHLQYVFCVVSFVDRSQK
jgi:hypothetical protein